MNELPQPKPTTKFVKALFYNLCLAYGYEDNNLQELADIAKVHKSFFDAMFVSVEAHVRYETVYNAKKEIPIMAENAVKIKDAVLRLTGVPYVGSFVLVEESAPASPQRPNGNPRHHHLL